MAALGVRPVVPMVREGVCHGCKGHAWCCTFLRLQVPPNYFDDADVKHWVELHGVTVQRIGEATYAVLNRKCGALAADGTCTLYGKPERPGLCAEWPATPAALSGMEDVCGFSFQSQEP